MKYDFIYSNPTTIYFGKDSLSYLKDELDKYGPHVLLAYGGGSIKKYGIYAAIIEELRKSNKEVIELSNILPNPSYQKVLEGVELCTKHHIDLILAVGGGSVIDCAKAISVGAKYKGDDIWQKYFIDQDEVTHDVIPVGSILTMVGTGSEMNGGSVITNEEKKMKVGRVFPASVYPRFSILNPIYTYTVPHYQMVSGIFDIFSHLMEQYFSGDDDNVSDDLLEALMISLIKNTYKAIENPHDYEARSNIMWIATMALNKITCVSKLQDWVVHGIEHQLGAYTNCAHGMGLAAISLPYYRYMIPYGLAKFVRYAINVFDVRKEGKSDLEIAYEGIDKLEQFMKDVGIVYRLRDLGASLDQIPLIASSCSLSGHGYHLFTVDEIIKILEECY